MCDNGVLTLSQMRLISSVFGEGQDAADERFRELCGNHPEMGVGKETFCKYWREKTMHKRQAFVKDDFNEAYAKWISDRIHHIYNPPASVLCGELFDASDFSGRGSIGRKEVIRIALAFGESIPNAQKRWNEISEHLALHGAGEPREQIGRDEYGQCFFWLLLL